VSWDGVGTFGLSGQTVRVDLQRAAPGKIDDGGEISEGDGGSQSVEEVGCRGMA